jgi:hypothetical protein
MTAVALQCVRCNAWCGSQLVKDLNDEEFRSVEAIAFLNRYMRKTRTYHKERQCKRRQNLVILVGFVDFVRSEIIDPVIPSAPFQPTDKFLYFPEPGK